MLIGILAVIWIAVLSPIIIRRLRDQDTDRSIVNFHERMARLGGPNPPLVSPAHRLDVSDETPPRELLESEINPPSRAPHLRVVPIDATRTDLERDQSWDEWSLSHSDDPYEHSTQARRSVVQQNPRAAAYSRVPATNVAAVASSSPYGSRSQRIRRRRTLLTLIASTVLSSAGVLLVNSIIVDVAALLAWTALIGFLALMYYALTTGLMSSTSARRSPPVRRVEVQTNNEFDSADELDQSETSAAGDDHRYARAL
jgi:hypothetical protein